MSLKARKTTTMRIHPDLRRVWESTMKPRQVTTIRFTECLAALVTKLSPEDRLKLCPPPAPKAFRGGRKGITDSLTILFMVFIGAMLILAAIWLSNSFKEVFVSWQTEMPEYATNLNEGVSAMDRLPPLLNFIVALGFVALSLITIGLSYFTPSHPMLAIIVLPVLILGVYFGAHLSNAWDSMTEDATDELRSAVEDASFIDLLLSHLVEAWLGMAFLAAIAFYVGLKHRAVVPGGGSSMGGFS